MKRFNILYILLIPCAYLLYLVGSNYKSEGAFFYGFAENKETELNLDIDCLIAKVYVSPGEEVKEGQLLLEASQAKYDIKLNDLEYDLKEQQVNTELEKTKLSNSISQLEIRKRSDIAELDTEIRSLRAKIELNEKLFDQISSIQVPESSTINKSARIELNELENKRAEIIAPFNQQLDILKSQLKNAGQPQVLQRQRINKEKELVGLEKEKLQIFAPSDGLIGNVHCIDGEHISSFNTLISFYERNPTLVKGFVHEKLILEVKTDADLTVSSSQHPNHEVSGKVIGLGTRIVEIPERLRKIPEQKTYGREVLIKIPANNPFLQKEKVTLNSTNRREHNFLLSFFK
jgi:multidrug resistance efflux pump